MTMSPTRHRLFSTRAFAAAALAGIAVTLTSCGDDMLRRKHDVKQAQGADPDLQERFGITNDAQDPTQRDKDLGYGRWKQAPETEGTASPTSPQRRTFGDD